jgi:porphobilinogen synthase
MKPPEMGLPPSAARARFPATRMRRTRQSPWIRGLVREHQLHPSDLVLPLFVIEGTNRREAIDSLPDISRLSINLLVETAQQAAKLGIPAVALFPAVDPEFKTSDGREAWNPDSLVCQAVRTLKTEVPEIGVICDVALDPYTDHGHDGLVQDGQVVNDETVAVLVRQALTLAAAGCDVVAPSDMMDGRIGAIRSALEKDGFANTMILSYAAKYASTFYGPFRDAVGSASALGTADKATYQMDPANSAEAVREVLLDVEEGADMVMIKPGMPYLDIIHDIAQATSVPVFAYQVSGEYAMLANGAAQGLFDRKKAFHESLMAFKRAGARGVLTYAALEIAADLTGAA